MIKEKQFFIEQQFKNQWAPNLDGQVIVIHSLLLNKKLITFPLGTQTGKAELGFQGTITDELTNSRPTHPVHSELKYFIEHQMKNQLALHVNKKGTATFGLLPNNK